MPKLFDRTLQVGAAKAIWRAKNELLIPPSSAVTCVDCRGDQALHWHHESYEPEVWLDVVPLCAACHKQRHLFMDRLVDGLSRIELRDIARRHSILNAIWRDNASASELRRVLAEEGVLSREEEMALVSFDAWVVLSERH
jgi:hypothetical protein